MLKDALTLCLPISEIHVFHIGLVPYKYVYISPGLFDIGLVTHPQCPSTHEFSISSSTFTLTE